MSNIATIEQDIIGTKDAFLSVLTDRSINFEREAEFAIQSLMNSDYAIKIATENRQSVVNAVTNIAAIGISLNPAKKQAYLVPRDRKICLDISYIGLMDLAMDTGSLRWAQAALVYSNDTFSLTGFDKAPDHTFNPFSTDRGDVVGVYVVVKTADGDYLTTTMGVDEVNSIRDRSSAWKAWISKKASCPWVTDWGEMAKKTCVKRAYKFWPKTERLETAIHHLNTDSGEGLAVLEHKKEPARAALPVPVDSPERDALYASLQDIATGGIEAYAQAWASLTKEQRTMIGQAAHAGLKDAAEAADLEVPE